MSQYTSIWPPVLSNLASSIQTGDKLVLAFAPFIRSDALEVFLDTFPTESARIVVRWKVSDLLAGASDLGIFELLEKRGVQLYTHPNIHLKLLEFSSGIAYVGSSNITNNGLSIKEDHNEEMGVLFPLDLNSYTHIRRLCDQSRKVTKEIVDAYQKAIDVSQVEPPIIGELILPPIEEKEFLISELPASNSPQAFLAAVSNYLQNKEMCPRMLHDVGTYKFNNCDLQSADLDEKLIHAFQNQAFVKHIVAKIRSEPYMNFGAVTAYVHNVAQDVPLPYRSSIKESIATLYNWLSHCFEDLSWSVPGAQSQVIKSSLYTQTIEQALRFSIRKKRR